MRFHSLVLLLALSSSTACKKNDAPASGSAAPAGSAAPTPAGSAAPTPAPAGSAAPTPAPAPAGSAAPAAGKLTCDKILPKDIRDKYFKDYEITDNPQPVDFTGECKMKKGKESASLQVSCHDNVALAMKPTIDGMKGGMLKGKEVAGIGKGAVMIEGGKMAGQTLPNQITAWDDDSNCNVHVNVPAAMDIQAIAKDMLAALPPK